MSLVWWLPSKLVTSLLSVSNFLNCVFYGDIIVTRETVHIPFSLEPKAAKRSFRGVLVPAQADYTTR